LLLIPKTDYSVARAAMAATPRDCVHVTSTRRWAWPTTEHVNFNVNEHFFLNIDLRAKCQVGHSSI
jgi:hypothetical protein